ncbi:unnamed protein product [Microthlaspi erraticum]|uniref:Reverse transcriptase domain-containing protein n=1 Tax=Microthlaspi erraticum TaxID=1685480 RepID=A0A6D2IGU9_9BRAS|nr:unnamed protein product [Microthlaspi erraticum]
MEDDDLLGEELMEEAEQIEAISQLSPMATRKKVTAGPTQKGDGGKPRHTKTEILRSRVSPRQRTSIINDAKSTKVSRKMKNMCVKASPKKRSGVIKGTPIPASSKQLPQHEVFPSALSKKPKSATGSVVSQKPPKGRSGGLALYYSSSSSVTILSSSPRMIDIEAVIEGVKVFMTFVYGEPVTENRGSFWECLSDMSFHRRGAWLMIGDFNEITGNHEKRGGRRRSDTSFLDFRRMLANCGMIDFPFKGNCLSWVGYRASGKVQCRLDRAVGNEDWHHSFSHTNVEYLHLWGSDHRPVLARIMSHEAKVKRNFRFDKRWLGKDGFKDTVTSGWRSSPSAGIGNVHGKIQSCRRAISSWKRLNKSNSALQIEAIKEQLERAQTDDSVPSEEVMKLKWDLCNALRDEELFWRQKSRVSWLKEGDRNTKFFHATTKQRRARNRITKLKRQDGSWAETEDSIEQTATGYFQNLFSSSRPGNFEEALKYLSTRVTPAMNTALTRAPSNDEIKKAIAEINPDKAPGPDGMTSLFFQRFWEVTAQDIITMVKEFFETNSLDAKLNQTNICLIPKTERPRDMTEFRPISLCNVSYKIISKILSNRLKRCLPKIISETQSAFVARRLITDNILIAQECFHGLRTNSMCKTKFIAVKTDMSKAYDRVEWSFLEALMLKLGFAESWVHWIKLCISSVSYQVLLNGEAKGSIQPTRGLRQGDPLSPFLFIILTEALISQLRGAEEEGRLTGLKIARACPPVSHLLFADDSLFFCRADVLQCAELIKILKCYGLASGQQLNTAKSSVFFGSKVPNEQRIAIKNTLGISKEGGMGTYQRRSVDPKNKFLPLSKTGSVAASILGPRASYQKAGRKCLSNQ